MAAILNLLFRVFVYYLVYHLVLWFGADKSPLVLIAELAGFITATNSSLTFRAK